MKVEQKTTKKCDIHGLPRGETFVIEGDYFMKVIPTFIPIEEIDGYGILYAVELESGKLYRVPCGTQVNPIKIKIVVEG